MITIILSLILTFTFPSTSADIEVMSQEYKQAKIEYLNSINPDQDRKMSLLTNEDREQCFQCALPGNECYTYPKTCFPGTSW
ncbi:MAG: hypothetical protein ABJI33_11920 [Balneola sp.]